MDNVLSGILQGIDAISEFAGMTVRWLVVVMMLALLYEVVARYAFNSPTIWAHEFCTLLWGFYIMLGACYVLRYDAHVRLDLIYGRLPLRKQSIIDVITYLFFFLYCVAILWKAVPWAWQSLMIQERSLSLWRVPIWPVKVMVPIAVSLLLLQGMARYIRSLYAAITGRELLWR